MASATFRISAQTPVLRPASVHNAAHGGGAQGAFAFSQWMRDVADADTAKADARDDSDTGRDDGGADAAPDAPRAGLAAMPQEAKNSAAAKTARGAATDRDTTDKADTSDDEDTAPTTPDMPAPVTMLTPPQQQQQSMPAAQADGETADGVEDSAPVTATPTPAASSAPQSSAADKTATGDTFAAQQAAAQAAGQQSPVQAAKPAQPEKKTDAKAKADQAQAEAPAASPSASNARMDGTPLTFDPTHSQNTASGKSGTAGNKTDDPAEIRAAQAPQAEPAPSAATPPANGQTPIFTAAPIVMSVTQNGRAAHAAADKAEAQSPAPDMDGLAVQIAAKSQSGAKQFDIRLDPPELGRVDVRLSIDAAGKAQAHLTADQPQTLTLLQQDSASLTRALREAGLDVSQNGLNFSLRGNSGGNADAGTDGGRDGARRMPVQALKQIEASPIAATAWRAAADGRLDIRV